MGDGIVSLSTIWGCRTGLIHWKNHDNETTEFGKKKKDPNYDHAYLSMYNWCYISPLSMVYVGGMNNIL